MEAFLSLLVGRRVPLPLATEVTQYVSFEVENLPALAAAIPAVAAEAADADLEEPSASGEEARARSGDDAEEGNEKGGQQAAARAKKERQQQRQKRRQHERQVQQQRHQHHQRHQQRQKQQQQRQKQQQKRKKQQQKQQQEDSDDEEGWHLCACRSSSGSSAVEAVDTFNRMRKALKGTARVCDNSRYFAGPGDDDTGSSGKDSKSNSSSPASSNSGSGSDRSRRGSLKQQPLALQQQRQQQQRQRTQQRQQQRRDKEERLRPPTDEDDETERQTYVVKKSSVKAAEADAHDASAAAPHTSNSNSSSSKGKLYSTPSLLQYFEEHERASGDWASCGPLFAAEAAAAAAAAQGDPATSSGATTGKKGRKRRTAAEAATSRPSGTENEDGTAGSCTDRSGAVSSLQNSAAAGAFAVWGDGEAAAAAQLQQHVRQQQQLLENMQRLQLSVEPSHLFLYCWQEKYSPAPRFKVPLLEARLVNNITEKGPCVYVIASNGEYEFQCTDANVCALWLDTLQQLGCKLLRFTDLYQLTDFLGEGSFARVYMGLHLFTGEKVVIKAVNKKKVMESNVYTEIEVLRNVLHPYIIRLYAAYEQDEYVCLVLEYLPGGELFDYLSANGAFSEDHARVAMRRLLLALQCLHSKGIVHRDIKTENLILESAEDPTSLKLIDFGLASALQSPSMRMRCGSPGYVAPEILQDAAYGTKVDIFSAGIILYTLLAGFTPFRGPNIKEILRKNLRCQLNFTTNPRWASVTHSAKDLIAWMCSRTPEKRCAAAQALTHPWFYRIRPPPSASTSAAAAAITAPAAPAPCGATSVSLASATCPAAGAVSLPSAAEASAVAAAAASSASVEEEEVLPGAAALPGVCVPPETEEEAQQQEEVGAGAHEQQPEQLPEGVPRLDGMEDKRETQQRESSEEEERRVGWQKQQGEEGEAAQEEQVQEERQHQPVEEQHGLPENLIFLLQQKPHTGDGEEEEEERLELQQKQQEDADISSTGRPAGGERLDAPAAAYEKYRVGAGKDCAAVAAAAPDFLPVRAGVAASGQAYQEQQRESGKPVTDDNFQRNCSANGEAALSTAAAAAGEASASAEILAAVALLLDSDGKKTCEAPAAAGDSAAVGGAPPTMDHPANVAVSTCAGRAGVVAAPKDTTSAQIRLLQRLRSAFSSSVGGPTFAPAVSEVAARNKATTQEEAAIQEKAAAAIQEKAAAAAAAYRRISRPLLQHPLRYRNGFRAPASAQSGGVQQQQQQTDLQPLAGELSKPQQQQQLLQGTQQALQQQEPENGAAVHCAEQVALPSEQEAQQHAEGQARRSCTAEKEAQQQGHKSLAAARTQYEVVSAQQQLPKQTPHVQEREQELRDQEQPFRSSDRRGAASAAAAPSPSPYTKSCSSSSSHNSNSDSLSNNTGNYAEEMMPVSDFATDNAELLRQEKEAKRLAAVTAAANFMAMAAVTAAANAGINERRGNRFSVEASSCSSSRRSAALFAAGETRLSASESAARAAAAAAANTTYGVSPPLSPAAVRGQQEETNAAAEAVEWQRPQLKNLQAFEHLPSFQPSTLLPLSTGADYMLQQQQGCGSPQPPLPANPVQPQTQKQQLVHQLLQQSRTNASEQQQQILASSPLPGSHGRPADDAFWRLRQQQQQPTVQQQQQQLLCAQQQTRQLEQQHQREQLLQPRGGGVLNTEGEGLDTAESARHVGANHVLAAATGGAADREQASGEAAASAAAVAANDVGCSATAERPTRKDRAEAADVAWADVSASETCAAGPAADAGVPCSSYLQRSEAGVVPFTNDRELCTASLEEESRHHSHQRERLTTLQKEQHEEQQEKQQQQQEQRELPTSSFKSASFEDTLAASPGGSPTHSAYRPKTAISAANKPSPDVEGKPQPDAAAAVGQFTAPKTAADHHSTSVRGGATTSATAAGSASRPTKPPSPATRHRNSAAAAFLHAPRRFAQHPGRDRRFRISRVRSTTAVATRRSHSSGCTPAEVRQGEAAAEKPREALSTKDAREEEKTSATVAGGRGTSATGAGRSAAVDALEVAGRPTAAAAASAAASVTAYKGARDAQQEHAKQQEEEPRSENPLRLAEEQERNDKELKPKCILQEQNQEHKETADSSNSGERGQQDRRHGGGVSCSCDQAFSGKRRASISRSSSRRSDARGRSGSTTRQRSRGSASAVADSDGRRSRSNSSKRSVLPPVISAIRSCRGKRQLPGEEQKRQRPQAPPEMQHLWQEQHQRQQRQQETQREQRRTEQYRQEELRRRRQTAGGLSCSRSLWREGKRAAASAASVADSCAAGAASAAGQPLGKQASTEEVVAQAHETAVVKNSACSELRGSSARAPDSNTMESEVTEERDSTATRAAPRELVSYGPQQPPPCVAAAAAVALPGASHARTQSNRQLQQPELQQPEQQQQQRQEEQCPLSQRQQAENGSGTKSPCVQRGEQEGKLQETHSASHTEGLAGCSKPTASDAWASTPAAAANGRPVDAAIVAAALGVTAAGAAGRAASDNVGPAGAAGVAGALEGISAAVVEQAGTAGDMSAAAADVTAPVVGDDFVAGERRKRCSLSPQQEQPQEQRDQEQAEGQQVHPAAHTQEAKSRSGWRESSSRVGTWVEGGRLSSGGGSDLRRNSKGMLPPAVPPPRSPAFWQDVDIIAAARKHRTNAFDRAAAAGTDSPSVAAGRPQLHQHPHGKWMTLLTGGTTGASFPRSCSQQHRRPQQQDAGEMEGPQEELQGEKRLQQEARQQRQGRRRQGPRSGEEEEEEKQQEAEEEGKTPGRRRLSSLLSWRLPHSSRSWMSFTTAAASSGSGLQQQRQRVSASARNTPRGADLDGMGLQQQQQSRESGERRRTASFFRGRRRRRDTLPAVPTAASASARSASSSGVISRPSSLRGSLQQLRRRAGSRGACWGRRSSREDESSDEDPHPAALQQPTAVVDPAAVAAAVAAAAVAVAGRVEAADQQEQMQPHQQHRPPQKEQKQLPKSEQVQPPASPEQHSPRGQNGDKEETIAAAAAAGVPFPRGRNRQREPLQHFLFSPVRLRPTHSRGCAERTQEQQHQQNTQRQKQENHSKGQQEQQWTEKKTRTERSSFWSFWGSGGAQQPQHRQLQQEERQQLQLDAQPPVQRQTLQQVGEQRTAPLDQQKNGKHEDKTDEQSEDQIGVEKAAKDAATTPRSSNAAPSFFASLLLRRRRRSSARQSGEATARDGGDARRNSGNNGSKRSSGPNALNGSSSSSGGNSRRSSWSTRGGKTAARQMEVYYWRPKAAASAGIDCARRDSGDSPSIAAAGGACPVTAGNLAPAAGAKAAAADGVGVAAAAATPGAIRCCGPLQASGHSSTAGNGPRSADSSSGVQNPKCGSNAGSSRGSAESNTSPNWQGGKLAELFSGGGFFQKLAAAVGGREWSSTKKLTAAGGDSAQGGSNNTNTKSRAAAAAHLHTGSTTSSKGTKWCSRATEPTGQQVRPTRVGQNSLQQRREKDVGLPDTSSTDAHTSQDRERQQQLRAPHQRAKLQLQWRVRQGQGGTSFSSSNSGNSEGGGEMQSCRSSRRSSTSCSEAAVAAAAAIAASTSFPASVLPSSPSTLFLNSRNSRDSVQRTAAAAALCRSSESEAERKKRDEELLRLLFGDDVVQQKEETDSQRGPLPGATSPQSRSGSNSGSSGSNSGSSGSNSGSSGSSRISQRNQDSSHRRGGGGNSHINGTNNRRNGKNNSRCVPSIDQTMRWDQQLYYARHHSDKCPVSAVAGE